MARPHGPPPFPPSLIAEDIRTLVGFGLQAITKPPRFTHGPNPGGWPSNGSAKIFNRKPSHRAYFEFGPSKPPPPGLFDRPERLADFGRQVFVAHEDKRMITHIAEVHAAEIPGPNVLLSMAPMVCSLHMFQTFDGSPLLVLIDEQYDRVVLAIGNMGEHPIEFRPRAPRGYRPAWYRDMKVRDDFPVLVNA